MSNKTHKQSEFLPGFTAAEYEKHLQLHDFDGKTVGEKLDEFAQISDANVEKGKKFEQLTQWALPLISDLGITSVKSPRSTDIGVDLIATHEDGYQIAIQCKFWTTRNITWKDISTFIGAAKQADIAEKWLVFGALGFSINAVTTDAGFDDVKVIDMRNYSDTVLTIEPRKIHEPLKLQKPAINTVANGLKNAEPGKHGDRRGTLIMACGTGKTFTALRIAEQIPPADENTAANILFIAPSIALVAQARREWREQSLRRLRTLVICSDETAGDNEEIQPNEIAGRVTTEPKKIAAYLNSPIRADEAQVTFCTYQSLPKLIEAQHKHQAPKFDLAIVDEAHRTAGLLKKKDDESDFTYEGFKTIHDAAQLRADYRLYMTATPRIYGESKVKKNIAADENQQLVEMNDEIFYGETFANITFKQAVEADILCDYRVIALGLTESIISAELIDQLLELNDDKDGVGEEADAQSVLALGAIAMAINGFIKGDDHPDSIARTIVFANNIRRSKWLTKAVNSPGIKKWVAQKSDDRSVLDIDAKHLDGTYNAAQRRTGLDWLRDADDVQPRLISNARLFTEGIDVPALNAIAFLDPRQSKVDTVQAVGRAMRIDRKNPHKKFGYVIAPVIMAPGENLLTTLQKNNSRFESLGVILNAMRSHDGSFDTKLHVVMGEVLDEPDGTKKAPPTSGPVTPDNIPMLTEQAKNALSAQMAKNVGIKDNPGETVADEIASEVEKAATMFKEAGVAHRIAETIGTPLDNATESCTTAALLIVNACIMHKRLDSTGNLYGLTNLEDAKRDAETATAFYAAWLTILEKDYRPIFQDATALMQKFIGLKKCRTAIKLLAMCAMTKAERLNDLGFDHAGHLYHLILGSAKSSGAYYTKNRSAYLLAGLAFDDSFVDWSDKKAVQKLKIADPACGTGTLLMAALKAIKDKAAAAQGLSDAQQEHLHKHLVENVIHGFDINLQAIQLAACNLTIGAPNTDYRGMNLYTLQHGPLRNTAGDKPEDVRHGALEILLGKAGEESVQVCIADLDDEVIYGADAERRRKEFRPPQNLDAMIFNPPFTKTTEQNTHFNDATVKSMRERLTQLRQHLIDNEADSAHALAEGSIQPYFIPVVHRLINKTKGVFGMIVPTTVCTAENARGQRQYLAKHFHIDIVLTSHDKYHKNFANGADSIFTSMIIGRRGLGTPKPTRFIQLAKYPTEVLSAFELIAAIQSGKPSESFTRTLWPAERVKDGNWSPVQWFNPALAHIAEDMNTLPNCSSAGDSFEMQFRTADTHEFFNKKPSENGNAFCTIKTNVMLTINSQPETKVTPKTGSERQAKRTQKKASHFLIGCLLRTTTSRLMAVYSETPAIGTVFRPIKAKDKNTAKAYAVFMNSTFGIIQMLNRRSGRLDLPAYEYEHLKTIRLPDPALDLSPLLKAFEKTKDTPLERISQCHTDPARKILDHAAAKCLGVDPAKTAEWRKLLAAEPTITNRPAAIEK